MNEAKTSCLEGLMKDAILITPIRRTFQVLRKEREMAVERTTSHYTTPKKLWYRPHDAFNGKTPHTE
jgi:hypothetical protein